jgi:hypothetical protein
VRTGDVRGAMAMLALMEASQVVGWGATDGFGASL